LTQPTPGLRLARDPRIPDRLEVFPMRVETSVAPLKIEWLLNGQVIGRTDRDETEFQWALVRGEHTATARVWSRKLDHPTETPAVRFIVQ